MTTKFFEKAKDEENFPVHIMRQKVVDSLPVVDTQVLHDRIINSLAFRIMRAQEVIPSLNRAYITITYNGKVESVRTPENYGAGEGFGPSDMSNDKLATLSRAQLAKLHDQLDAKQNKSINLRMEELEQKFRNICSDSDSAVPKVLAYLCDSDGLLSNTPKIIMNFCKESNATVKLSANYNFMQDPDDKDSILLTERFAIMSFTKVDAPENIIKPKQHYKKIAEFESTTKISPTEIKLIDFRYSPKDELAEELFPKRKLNILMKRIWVNLATFFKNLIDRMLGKRPSHQAPSIFRSKLKLSQLGKNFGVVFDSLTSKEVYWTKFAKRGDESSDKLPEKPNEVKTTLRPPNVSDSKRFLAKSGGTIHGNAPRF